MKNKSSPFFDITLVEVYMRNRKYIKYAACAAIIGSLSLSTAAEAGEIYSTVSKNMVYNFNSDSDAVSWYTIFNNADIKNILLNDKGDERAARMSVKSGGGRCSMAKNFRSQACPFVLEFKVMPESENGKLDVIIYDRASRGSTILTVKDCTVIAGGKSICNIQKDEYTKISAIVSGKNKFDLYIDESLAKKDISFASKIPVNAATAVRFSYEAQADSSIQLDNVYAYEGNMLMDEFYMLGDEEKALYRTKNAAAFVSGYSVYCADNRTVELGEDIYSPRIIDGKFYLPVSAALNSLGIEASFDGEGVAVNYNGVRYYVASGDKKVKAGNEINLTVPALYGGSDVLVCADDIASIFQLSKYFDGTDMYILSREDSVYKKGDDTENLVLLLKKNITNLLYAYDSTGRLVKIGSSLELFKGEIIPAANVSAPYQPEEANPVTSAVDGNIATRFAFDGSENYFDIDLGEVCDIEAFAIAWMNGHTRKDIYVMSYSVDGQNWTSLPLTMSTGLSSEYQYHPLGIRARYIRYNGQGTIANSTGAQGIWNSVNEIVFFRGDKE